LVTPATERGTCGASADTIVARNLLMMVARGMAAHAAHARHVAATLLIASSGKSSYQIKDEQKLKTVASRLKLDIGQPTNKIAQEVANIALDDIRGNHTQKVMRFASAYVPSKVAEGLLKLKVLPQSAGEDLLDATHQTAMGVMAEPVSLLLETVKLSLADITALIISTELQDVLFGTPSPVVSTIGFRTLREDEVNIVVHGHVPILSEKIVEWSKADQMINKAKQTGAQGINVVGVCCTGNEVLMRQGVAIAGSNLQQELILATGLVEAMVIDVQCIYPAITDVASQFHTKVISTMKEGKMLGAIHIPFEEETADKDAIRIIEEAIDNYSKRTNKIYLPKASALNLMAGFSVEACISVLSKLDATDPLKPLIDNIANGNIQGVVLLAGCTSPKVQADASHVKIAKALMADNILIVATGCAAQACARAGLLTSEATEEYAGKTLKAVLSALGQAAGLNKPLPPVWHFGSCVDNSRVVLLVAALAEKLGVHIKDLPIAASAAEWITEKAAAIGTGAVALGVTTHLGITPPVLGGETVVNVLTDKASELFGGRFIVEIDPEKAAESLKEVIRTKREALS
jgi:carbon-monoxide dehydrogenase catalytic subunit